MSALDGMRHARDLIEKERNAFAAIAERPRGYGPGAARAYANRAYGMTFALEILRLEIAMAEAATE